MRFERLKRRTQIVKGHLDIAPLVDVMFLLLIFFMLTSNFVIQPGIKVALPKAVTSEVLSSRNVTVTLTGQDLLFLEDQPASVADLVKELKVAAAEDKAVLLRADGGASLRRVVEIWDICRDAGISQINIATTQKGATPA